MNSFPFHVERLPRQRLVVGFLVTVGGWILFIVLFAVGLSLFDSLPFQTGFPIVSFLLFFGIAFVQWMSRIGKRLRQPDAITAISRDARSPVLLLRSFNDDDAVDLTSQLGRQGARRTEENLCAALRRIGPVIAVGRPSEPIPEVGAARLYLRDDDWQRAVIHLMEMAAASVFVVGRHAGVWWEIQTALSKEERTRLLFFFPYVEDKATRRSFWHVLTLRYFVLPKRVFEAMERDRQERYLLFRERTSLLLDRPLPETLGTAQFLDFDGDGVPRLLETVRPIPLVSLNQVSLTNSKVGVHMERTLAPFVEKLEKASPRPRTSSEALST